LKKDAIFKEEVLKEVTQSLKNGHIESPMFIWMVINYVMWREKWK